MPPDDLATQRATLWEALVSLSYPVTNILIPYHITKHFKYYINIDLDIMVGYQVHSLQWLIMDAMASAIISLASRLFTQPLFRSRSKKRSKLRVTGLFEGIHRWLMNSPHKRPVTRKMFPHDDVTMLIQAVATRFICLLYHPLMQRCITPYLSS